MLKSKIITKAVTNGNIGVNTDNKKSSRKADKKKQFNEKLKEKIAKKQQQKFEGKNTSTSQNATQPKTGGLPQKSQNKQNSTSAPVKANVVPTTSEKSNQNIPQKKDIKPVAENLPTKNKDKKNSTSAPVKTTVAPVKTTVAPVKTTVAPVKTTVVPNTTQKTDKKATKPTTENLPQKQWKKQNSTSAPAKTKFIANTTETTDQITPEKIDWFQKAEKLYLAKESKIKVKQGIDGSNDFLIKKLADKGTLKDKISSLCVLIEDNPQFCCKNLSQQLRIADSKDKKYSFVALDAIKSLMTKNLKTHFLSACLFQCYVQKKPDMKDTDLLDAYLYHSHKMFLNKLYKCLENKLKDPQEHFRKKTVDIVCNFAKELQNLENNGFLKLIVNKLGDSDELIIQSLLKTLDIVINKNTNLAVKIQKEVQILLNRPNLPNRVKFMAYTLMANVDYEKVEDKLICSKSQEIFSKQCKELLNDDFTEESSKFLNQCLRGINRIQPYLKDKDEVTKFVQEHADYLFKLAHTSVPRVKIQILLVQFHILKNDQYSSQNLNRYYRVVYEMVLNPTIINSNLNEIFLELLYNCIKDDLVSDRAHSFIKRLLQIAIHSEANVVVSILALIQKVGKARTDLSAYDITGKTMKNLLNDDDEEIPMDAVESEDSDNESKISDNESKNSDSKSKDSDDDQADKYIKKMASSSNNLSQINTENKQEEEFSYLNLVSKYDPFKIEPIYSGAKNTLYFELQYFQEHYHPTVRKIAEAIVDEKRFGAKSIEVSGNPLLDFSNNGFLNRLIMQKPKKRALYRKQNLMKRGRLGKYAYEEPFSVKDIYQKKANSENEDFIRKYFETKVNRLSYLEKREKKKDKKAAKGDAEEEEMDKFADDMFENELKKTDRRGSDDDFMDGFDDDQDEGFSGEDEISDNEDEALEEQGDDMDGDSLDNENLDLNADDFDEDMMGDGLGYDEDDMRDADGFLGKRPSKGMGGKSFKGKSKKGGNKKIKR